MLPIFIFEQPHVEYRLVYSLVPLVVLWGTLFFYSKIPLIKKNC